MGKGKGKSTKSAEKTAIKAAKKEAKRAARENGAPKPNHLLLKSLNKHKASLASKSKPQPPSTTPKPFVKTHAKWPSLFKRHLGVIESHIKALDRVMQSMKSEMDGMEEKTREEYELQEGGHWRRICGMLDRSREVLGQARECGVGILPNEYLRDKKGLGVTGTSFEPLEPKLKERAEKLGYNNRPQENGVQHGVKTDGEGDSEMEDVSSLSSDSDDADSPSSSDSDSSEDSDSEDGVKKTADDERAEKKPVPVVEPNPYFVIDTQPMIVRGINKHPLPSIGKSKVSEKAGNGEVKKAKKSKKEKVVEEPIDAEPEPEPAKEEPVQNGDSTKSKKRSHDDSPELKKTKKSKKEKAVVPAPEPEPAATEAQAQAQPEPEPAAAAPKKSKKRANSTTDDTEVKKSKKHKSAEPEASASIVDFNEVQRKLQAEVDAGEAEKRTEKAKKKRRRSSGEGVESVKKVRKGKSS